MPANNSITSPDFYENMLDKQAPLKNNTTIRTGGIAEYIARVSHMEQLLNVISLAHERGLPFYVLGKGSNVLIDDSYFQGIVIILTGDFCSIRVGADETSVTAGGGASLGRLAASLAESGFTGYEFLAGIPGTVGGAVRMNAGTGETEDIKHIFLEADVLEPATRRTVKYSLSDMQFGYRASVLSCSLGIILRATFSLKDKYDNPAKALKRIRELKAQKKRKSPPSSCTFGSIFKNPACCNFSAGRLLEQVGMKGMRSGDAMVAEEHANWIVNTGSARSADIKKLISIGQKRVFEQFGILLAREVVYLPEDMHEWT